MSDERYQMVKRIFHAACETAPSGRTRFLDEACADDSQLRREVDALLAIEDQRTGFLEKPMMEGREFIQQADASLAAQGRPESIPSAIGQFRIVRLLGEGGFASVYLAEQQKPVVRRVALKIIKLGMDTRQVIARFEVERQALAMMDHPNIAKVFDAGATDAGRPYFVMELIEGDPITQYCDTNNLTIPQRLELFVQVSQAVQHAHQKGIIHRDLKPSNVLVSTQDGRPFAKVIDFGIAKAIAARLTEKTLFTERKALIGTPEYMSPEQAEGSLDIDTRTDVYSLGVLLYELLTGSTPFDSVSLRAAAYAEIQRIIREVDPPTPSTRLSQSTETLSSVAAHRRLEPKKLGTTLRGDLDWIVMKALEKDRDRRYETANEFAMDIGRYLAGEAVIAAPPSKVYLFRKFVRRNKGPVAAAATVVLALVAGLAGTLWQAGVARRAEADERRVAQAEAAAHKEADSKRALAERVSAFMAEMLEGVRPAVAVGRDTTVLKEILDAAAARIEAGELRNEPDAEVRLRLTIGEVYREIAQYPPAEAMLKPTIDLARSLAPPGTDTPEIVASLRFWGEYLNTVGRRAEADPFLQQAVDISRRLHSGDHRDMAEVLASLALTRMNLHRFADAERLYQEALDMLQRLYKGDHSDVAIMLSNLAMARLDLGRTADAEPPMEQSAQMMRRVHKGDHPDVAGSLNNLAMVRRELGRLPDAESLFQQTLDMRRRLFKGDHPTLAATLDNLATVKRKLGNFADAEPLCREALEMYRRLFPGDNGDVAAELNNLAMTYLRLDRPADAEPLLHQALEMKRRLYKGEDHFSVAYALNNLGGVRKTLGHADEAEALFRQGLDMRQRIYKNADHPDVANSLQNVAGALVDLGRPAEAEPLYQQALEMLRRLQERDNLGVANLLGNIADCMEDLGRPNDAIARYREALGVQRDCLPADSPALASGLALLGSALIRLGGRERATEAESVLRECLVIRQKAFPDGHAQQWLKYDATSLLGRALAVQERFPEAEPLLLEGYTGLKDDPRVPGPMRAEDLDHKRMSVERIVRLYDAWHTAEPGKGYDAKAAEWRGKLAELQAATQPDVQPAPMPATSVPATAASSQPQ